MFDLILYAPVNNTATPATPQSRVKHSTTEPPISVMLLRCWGFTDSNQNTYFWLFS